jgi:hypothetical protein
MFASCGVYGDQTREGRMSEFPTETVTFLFTDVEGSTDLARRLYKTVCACLMASMYFGSVMCPPPPLAWAAPGPFRCSVGR